MAALAISGRRPLVVAASEQLARAWAARNRYAFSREPEVAWRFAQLFGRHCQAVYVVGPVSRPMDVELEELRGDCHVMEVKRSDRLRR